VAQGPARLKEAQKLGFARAVVPEAARTEAASGLTLNTVGSLVSLVSDIAARGEKSPAKQPARQSTAHRHREPEDA
jgi:DNA repair protein RadA/Sms